MNNLSRCICRFYSQNNASPDIEWGFACQLLVRHVFLLLKELQRAYFICNKITPWCPGIVHRKCMRDKQDVKSKFIQVRFRFNRLGSAPKWQKSAGLVPVGTKMTLQFRFSSTLCHMTSKLQSGWISIKTCGTFVTVKDQGHALSEKETKM